MPEPTFEIEDRDADGPVLERYWNCPQRWVPRNVLEFISADSYTRRYAGCVRMPEYELCSIRYKAALHVLEFEAEQARELRRKQHGRRGH